MEMAEDCGSQKSLLPVHSAHYLFLCLVFLYGGRQGWLIGNRCSCQLFWEQRYNAPSSRNTIQSVAPYCAAQKKDGQWKAGLQWDSIWLIYDETSQIPNGNRGQSTFPIEGRTVKCLVITQREKCSFICTSLSPVNHAWTASDWRRITRAQSEGPNAIILAGVPSLSVHPNPVNSLWQSHGSPFKTYDGVRPHLCN